MTSRGLLGFVPFFLLACSAGGKDAVTSSDAGAGGTAGTESTAASTGGKVGTGSTAGTGGTADTGGTAGTGGKADTGGTPGTAGPGVDAYRPPASAPGYYVDSVNGSDTADGRSPSTAWKTLGRIHNVVLVPGDVVRLARGSVWAYQHILLDNKSAGSATAPVVFEAYGTGEPPTISKPRALWDSSVPFAAVFFDSGSSYITVLDLRVEDCTVAVSMPDDSNHITIAGNEILRCGDGVGISGEYQKLLSNYIHDIGTSVEGNGGGIGAGMSGGSHLELAWNHFKNCWLPDSAIGPDGGAFEYYGRTVNGTGTESYYLSDDIQIHHNVIEGSYDFMESYGNVTNMVIAYNVYVNGLNEALEFHLDDSEHSTWTHECTYDVRIENNTFAPMDQNPGGWGIVGMLFDSNHPPDSSKSRIVTRNNIFVTNYKVIAQNVLGNNFVHDHNMYQLVGGGELGANWTLNATESIADPKFVDYANLDLRLTAGSPAIDVGGASSYNVDVLGTAVPTGKAPDMGAYEWH